MANGDHQLSVPHWVWEAYNRSPMAMRDSLVRQLRIQEQDEIIRESESGGEKVRGTTIRAQRKSWCPRCLNPIKVGDIIVMRDDYAPQPRRRHRTPTAMSTDQCSSQGTNQLAERSQ